MSIDHGGWLITKHYVFSTMRSLQLVSKYIHTENIKCVPNNYSAFFQLPIGNPKYVNFTFPFYLQIRSALLLIIPRGRCSFFTVFSFPVVDWFCLFIYLWVLAFPLQDCSEFGNFVITHMYYSIYKYGYWFK
jgi:hypothetical protein